MCTQGGRGGGSDSSWFSVEGARGLVSASSVPHYSPRHEGGRGGGGGRERERERERTRTRKLYFPRIVV